MKAHEFVVWGLAAALAGMFGLAIGQSPIGGTFLSGVISLSIGLLFGGLAWAANRAIRNDDY